VQYYVMTIPDRLFGEDAEFPWLSATERRAAAAFTGRKRRAQYAAGRLLLRGALDGTPGAPAGGWQVGAGARGKPEIANGTDGPAPVVSLSHCGSLALCAVRRSGGLLGVDVERCAPRRSDWIELARLALHPREAERLAGLAGPERWRGFYRCWTLKEALAKALGAGLALPFDRIAFSGDGRLEAAPDTCADASWRFVAFDVGGDFVGAAAWRPA
jgi:4'-phosphopantetheinyl transferase